ncbi:porin family protein [Shewanella atlantica]|uniref:Porin family protein n=1 Tax=Shewanella atlantica TaxID=271099 RepID=A0A3S0I9I0_9GAMM|nr:porin family protein [Shewanella atlantica]RTR27714.1 porin family protein [Shewanella atlantica]
MKNFKYHGTRLKSAWLCLPLISLLSTPLMAEEFYLGAAPFFSTLEYQEVSTVSNDIDIGAELFGGAKLNSYFGIEFGAGYGSRDGRDERSLYGDALVLGYYPYSSTTSFFLGAGPAWFGGEWRSVSAIGVDFQVSEALSLNLGYKRHFNSGVDGVDVDAFRFGIKYRFGGTKAARPTVIAQKSAETVTTAQAQESATAPPPLELTSPPSFPPTKEVEYKEVEYVVVEGEWIHLLLRERGMTMPQFLALNPAFGEDSTLGRDPERIYPGDHLVLIQWAQ